MIGSLFFNIIALLFALKGSLTKHSRGLLYSVISVFVFLAIRYDFGNDYMAYFERFHEINQYYSFSLDMFLIKGNEFGWVYLNHIFKPFGFFGMQIFLAGFSCYILYRFIEKYVHQKHYWFAMFIYIFQPYNMLVLSSAMRQAVVVSLFLLATDYLIQKKPIRYISIILFGSLFHTTSLFLLPLVFLSYVKIKPKIGYIFLLTLITFLFIYFGDYIFNLSSQLILQYFEDEYSRYLKIDSSNVGVGIGFAINTIIYIILFYNFKKTKIPWQVLIFNIIVLSFLFVPLSISIPLVSRINFYFTPFLMIGYPLALKNMKKQTSKLVFVGLIFISTIYQFFHFFNSLTWIEKFYEYKTIFSASILLN